MNRINAHPELDVHVIAPTQKGITIGSGVHESEKEIEFTLHRLQEYKTWYGKPFFKGFPDKVKEIKPDVIVIGWPYFLAFVFRPQLTRQMKKMGIRLVSKEIPFTVPAYRESLSDFSLRCAESQKTEKMFRSPLVFRFHKLLRKVLYTRVFDHAVLYIESGRKVISSYGLPDSQITVTYNSPDTDNIFKTIEAFKQQHPDFRRDPFRLLHVGRLVKWKNVHLLIDAIDELKDKYPELKLAVIGKGEEEENLKQQTKDLGLEERIDFLGAIYEGMDQTVEMMKSGVYVLAGMGGLSINEAMAHGLCIVCTIADGTEQHLVIDGLNGFKFRDNDKADLIAKIEMALKADRIKMGEESVNLIKNKYNIRTVSELYIRAFLSLKK